MYGELSHNSPHGRIRPSAAALADYENCRPCPLRCAVDTENGFGTHSVDYNEARHAAQEAKVVERDANKVRRRDSPRLNAPLGWLGPAEDQPGPRAASMHACFSSLPSALSAGPPAAAHGAQQEQAAAARRAGLLLALLLACCGLPLLIRE